MLSILNTKGTNLHINMDMFSLQWSRSLVKSCFKGMHCSMTHYWNPGAHVTLRAHPLNYISITWYEGRWEGRWHLIYVTAYLRGSWTLFNIYIICHTHFIRKFHIGLTHVVEHIWVWRLIVIFCPWTDQKLGKYHVITLDKSVTMWIWQTDSNCNWQPWRFRGWNIISLVDFSRNSYNREFMICSYTSFISCKSMPPSLRSALEYTLVKKTQGFFLLVWHSWLVHGSSFYLNYT